MKNLKSKFQDIHYNRLKPNLFLKISLSIGEYFYKKVIKFKNELYRDGTLKEAEVNAKVICVGNLTTGGVGKTPIVTYLANKLSNDGSVAIIQRGYGAKLQNKIPNIIKDFSGIKFENGSYCGDEPYQVASLTNENVIVITCKDRKKASEVAINEYGIKTIILDDGFSNRAIKKDETYLVIDSKMRFGNNHLLPYGPLREPVHALKRADKIILVNKNDENIAEAITWVKKKFKKEILISNMTPDKIYNLQTHAHIVPNNEKQNIIAVCAIGQPSQFYDFVKQYYNIVKTISFDDHHKYTKDDIKKLIKISKENNTNLFITTQKDETKLKELLKNEQNLVFNVLRLKTEINAI